MSNIVSALVQKRVVGSPTRKSILLYMAGCASDDGTGIWCSKATIARDLEYTKRTIQLAVDEILAAGLIQECGSRRCAHGYTVEYRICLDVVKCLPSTHAEGSKKRKIKHPELPLEPQETTGASDSPVKEIHPTRESDSPHGVNLFHPNHTGTVREYVCGRDVVSAFERFWKVYPRPRDRDLSLKEFREAVNAGAVPEAIVRAAEAYALDNRENLKGHKRQYIAYSDNWLKARRWKDAGEQDGQAMRGKPAFDGVSPVARFWAEKINQGAFVPRGAVTASVAQEIVAAGLVQPDRLRQVAG